MIRTTAILQMEASECGAAALGIILAYHGRHEPMGRLREACGVSRDGANAAQILTAARQFGLTARAFRCEPEQLRRMRGPFIIFWEFNHFLVVEQFGRSGVYLNDPSSGRRTVPNREFGRSFTGIALTFEQGPGFQKIGKPYSVWPGLRRRLRGQTAGVLLGLLAAFALVLPHLVASTLPKIFVDAVAIAGASGWSRALLAAMLAAAAVLGFLTWLQQRALVQAETRFCVEASSRFFWHVLRLPLEFFARRHAGEIGFRIGANDRIGALIVGELGTHLVNAVTASLCLTLLIWYDAGLTLVCLGIASLNVAALKLMERRRSEVSLRLSQERGNLEGFTIGGLRSIDTLKAMGAETDFFMRWAGHHARASNADQDLQSASQALSLAPPLLTGLSSAAVIGFGSLRIIDGLMSAGMLIAFQALLQSFLTPVNKLIRLGGSMQEIAGDLRRLDDVLEHPPAPAAMCDSADTGERLTGRIELRDLSFGYSRSGPSIIEGLSLTIPAGSRVALVGSSGSGKSTLAGLICGLYQPWKGEILFDGRPLAAIPREVVTNSLALVEQDPIMFDGTVSENIALWDDSLDEEALERAARDAAIHDEIMMNPGGYAYHLEELGKNMSGGQRQRIEIARALAGNPRILVLDEATSALDPLSENQVIDNLRRRGCTCVIVAHRLSTVRDCDQIVVLEKGRIVEQGSHITLVQAGGVYARLYAG
jgi:NHLM bacteriocin system ABC transporter peptidase/ATP-binding protein